ncbi:brachyurin [Frankliniella occidentalis]|uniref:Brachyurin n=1 Tax=Frankliniella occidentalis TaxID=133901 RepID=A0A6J1T440_FRAOC|nr:brachyurin [Frankliniella occidentalis]
MRLIAAVVCSLLAVVAGDLHVVEDVRPIPHQAALFDPSGQFFCSGVILSETAILTAGRCIFWTDDNIEIRAGIGKLDQQDDDIQKRTVSKDNRFLHQTYDILTSADDIAIIKLTEPLKLVEGVVEPVQLPGYLDERIVWEGKSVNISGWGKIGDKTSTYKNEIQRSQIKLVDLDLCKVVYGHNVIGGNKLCAASHLRKHPCTGEPGGPVTIHRQRRPLLLGIVAFGSPKGCHEEWPAVFTRVTAYLSFIEKHTGIELTKKMKKVEL